MDRLSNLPDSLLYHIFSFMPMQDVIKTTLLSKRWNGLWISFPCLIFDRYPLFIDKKVDFVNKILICRGCSKVKKFAIMAHLDTRKWKRFIDFWILYAKQNDVEELILDLLRIGDCYELPQFFYSCSSLRILILGRCKMSSVGQISWPSLKSLTLHYVILPEEGIQNLLLGCPGLESLEMYGCSGIKGFSTNSTCLKELKIHSPEMDDTVVKISAPNVTSLHLSGCLPKTCLVIDMSSLHCAVIDVYEPTFEIDERQKMLSDVLGSLGHVENLTLGAWCMKVLAIKEKKGLSSPPSKLKCLTLRTCIKQEDLLGILHMLKCSPGLETLVLEMKHSDKNSVFPLIEFLLKNAKVLETMKIRAQKVDSNSLESLFLAAQKLLAMPRLSTGAVVKLLK